MKILLVGGSGYIGRKIAPILIQFGHSVISTSRLAKPGFTPLDVSQYFEARNILKILNPDAIINLSWYSGPGYVESHLNYECRDRAIQLQRLVLDLGINKYVEIGSAAEYGSSAHPCSITGTPLNGKSLYAKSKIETFGSFTRILSNSSLEATWIRLFNLYGPNQDSSRLFPKLLNSLSDNQVFLLKNPDAMRDWIYVDDLANALQIVLTNSSPTVLNVGSGIGITNRNLCRLLEMKLGLKWKVFQDSINESSALVSQNDNWLSSKWTPKMDIVCFMKLQLQ